LDNTFNEKQNVLTNQMQKIDEAIEHANLVNNQNNKSSNIYLFCVFSHWNFLIVYLKILQQQKF